MTGKTERLIVPAQLRTEELPFHHTGKGKGGASYHCMNNSLVAEADIYVDLNHIEQVSNDIQSYVEPHKHSVSKVFTIIGNLTVDVMLDGENHEVCGPVSIFVPPGMMHALRPLKGTGYIMVVMTGGEYEASR